MIDAQLAGQWKLWVENFTVTNTTLAKIIADVAPPNIQPAASGEAALPGEGSVRQRVLTGGQRIINGSISSTDGTARDVKFWVGRQASLFANMGAPSITGTNTINRTVNSFVSDGWKPGDVGMIFGATTAANNGSGFVVTAVTALAITVNGTPFTNETFPAGTRLFRIAQWTQRNIPINAGNGSATPPVQLLGGTQDPDNFAAPDIGLSLGPDDALIANMLANVSALPAFVGIRAHAALY